MNYFCGNSTAAEKVNKALLKKEMADVLTFCFLLADKHNLDVKDVIMDKISINNQKYPVDKAKGAAKNATNFKPTNREFRS